MTLERVPVEWNKFAALPTFVCQISGSDQWIEYEMPEPYAHDRRSWIDNSTDPISVGYADAPSPPSPACGQGYRR